ncbi:MAG: hypothetical protein HQL32_09490 [Planctomycetes bacterium]|nr:hypothetical protein [Planctomycetota bacterium]
MNKKKQITTAIFTAIGAAIGSGLVNAYFSNRPINFEKELMKASAEINKNCPMVLDKHTQLNTTLGGPGKKLTYIYSLTNIDTSLLDKENFTQEMRPQLLNNVKTNPDMKFYQDNDIDLVYQYNEPSGNIFVQIKIDGSEY